jgi:hypothetical protein
MELRRVISEMKDDVGWGMLREHLQRKEGKFKALSL